MESGFAEGYAVGKDSSGSNNGGGFGGWGAEWIWIIVLFALWQNGGWGNNGGGGNGGIGTNYVLATDFATIERKLDSVNSGICDATFALNNTITNGNFNIINSLTQGFAGLNTGMLQGNYALSSQLADCCCKTQSGLKDLMYSNSQGFCDLKNAMFLNTRDVIENQNANYRAIHEELIANKLEAKNERIAELTMQLNRADLRASQEAQNAYLLSELKPCPSAAYIVPNPNCCYNYDVRGVGYGSQGNGCGCC